MASLTVAARCYRFLRIESGRARKYALRSSGADTENGAQMREYCQAVGAAKTDEPVLLLVNRKGETIFLAV